MTNNGNTPLDVTFAAADPELLVRTTFIPPVVTVMPKTVATPPCRHRPGTANGRRGTTHWIAPPYHAEERVMKFGYFTLSDNGYRDNPRTANQFIAR